MKARIEQFGDYRVIDRPEKDRELAEKIAEVITELLTEARAKHHINENSLYIVAKGSEEINKNTFGVPYHYYIGDKQMTVGLRCEATIWEE